MNGEMSFGITTPTQTPSYIYNNLVIQKYPNAIGSYGIFANNIPNVVMNNFVVNNFNTGIAAYSPSIAKNNVVINCRNGIGGDAIIKYNNAWNNSEKNYHFTPDSTNLSVNPMVVSEEELDFHLQMFSPLIDAGDPGILDLDSTRSDIGLFGGPFGEITIYKDLPPVSPKGLSVNTDSSMIYINWKRNTEADFRSYILYSDTLPGFTADTSSMVTELNDTFYIQLKPEGVSRVFYKLKSTDNQGNISNESDEVGVVLLGIKDGEYEVIQDYQLYQNYPNPFNPVTKIPFRLKERGYVKLRVYDINGELVSTLINGEKEAGYHEAEFTAASSTEELIPGIASGIYIYQIDVKNSSGTPQFRQSGKMVLLK
jgi:hypothetical protein